MLEFYAAADFFDDRCFFEEHDPHLEDYSEQDEDNQSMGCESEIDESNGDEAMEI